MIDHSLFKNIPQIILTDTAKKYQSSEALPLLEISTELCQATVSLYGGQILAFKSQHQQPLLWLSPLAKFTRGTPIRGGIPICAPWFGKHHNSDFPNHGFARTSDWQLSDCQQLDNKQLKITLTLAASPKTAALGYNDFIMTVSFILGSELTVEFSMSNNENQPINCGWALHSYFAVASVAAVKVSGLDGYDYLDATLGAQQSRLNGSQAFNGEVDRYFINASTNQTIDSDHPIHLNGHNCNTVITWNPGAELAATMPDIGVENFQNFVCVERGCAYDDSWLIASATTVSASLVISQ